MTFGLSKQQLDNMTEFLTRYPEVERDGVVIYVQNNSHIG